MRSRLRWSGTRRRRRASWTKSLKAGGLKLEPDLMVGIAVPVLAALAVLAVRRARRHAAEEPTP